MTARIMVVDDVTGLKSPRLHRCDGRLYDWMLKHLPPDEYAGRPINVMRNGARVEIEDWDFIPAPGDSVAVVVSPADAILTPIAISLAVSLASAAVSAALAPDIKRPRSADVPEPSPTYSAAPPRNVDRLGGAIGIAYGRLTIVPDLAAMPYSYFEGNQHYAECLLCIGHGHYNVSRMFAGESDLDRLPDGVAEWRIYGPDDHGQVHGAIADDFGLWGEDVVTSPDVERLELSERSFTTQLPAAVDFIASDTIRVWVSAGALEDFEDGAVITVSGSGSNDGNFTIASQSAGAGYVDFDVSSGITGETITLSASLGSWDDVQASKASSVQTYTLVGGQDEGGLGLSAGDVVRVTCSAGNDQYGEVKRYSLTYGADPNTGDRITTHTLKIRRVGGTLNSGTVGTVEVFRVTNAPTLEIGVSKEWRGWFNVTKSGQPVEAIALDFEFPAGLFQPNETTGDAEEAEVEIRIQYQPIDDDGETTGDAVNVDLTIATTDHLPTGTPITTPVRFTHEITPAEGQYRLRVRRTSATPDDARGQSRIDWVGLKGRRPVQASPVYGKTTLAAVRIRASEGLSGEAISTIRAEVARRLPPIGATRDETALGQTRNPATAIFDMATDPDYGMGLDPAETFDLAELAAAKALWNSAGLTFDHHFTEFTTLWEAMGLAAQAALAEPLAYAGTVTIAQDGPKASPVQMFSPQNITAGENGGSSLEIDYAFDRSRDVDGVRIVYRDQASAKERSAVWPAGAATPTEEAIAGITSDAIALDMAKIRWRQRQAARFRATWETELEGRVPRRGDLVRLADPMASDCAITAILAAADGDDLTLDRDMPVDLPAAAFVMLKDSDGTPTNWLAATKTGARTLTLDSASPITLRPRGVVGEPTHVVVSAASGAALDLIVEEVETSGPLTMRLQARGYAPGAYAGTFAESLET